MRELTAEELDLISGGSGGSEEYDNEDVVVTGSPYFPPYYPTPPYNPVPPPPPPSYYPPYTPVPSTPVDSYPPDWNYQRDFNIDHLAQSTAQAITNMPDSSTIEYSAFIYKLPDGSLHASNIVRGNEYNTGQHDASEFGFPAGATIVADIHSHPTYYPGYPDPNANAIQADNGDIRGMQSYHAQSQDSQYRSYIVSNGYVSEYDWVQNQTVPVGPDTSVNPNAVRGGFYPDLGT